MKNINKNFKTKQDIEYERKIERRKKEILINKINRQVHDSIENSRHQSITIME